MKAAAEQTKEPLISLGATCEPTAIGRRTSLGLIGAGAARASGRYEQIRDYRGICLHGVGCRRTIGDAKWSGTIAAARGRNGIDASTDYWRVLHRGNDGVFLQRCHRPEHRRLWRKKRFRIDRIDRRIEHRPGRQRIVDSAMPRRAAVQRIVQLIETGRTGVEARRAWS